MLSSKRRWIAAAAALLLLFLLRPGASRLKSRIIFSMSSAIGRSVDIGSVRLRLLPRPGFDLENLTVYDDQAFGAEPMLRASEVTASLRLFSLVRGRIEIARLDLSEPSLNLVHGENGRWNLEALLERSAQRPLAPTGKPKSESRPGFPYIEAASARINFKNGFEKKPFALTNADFSLWQDSENSWGVRLQAQPVRSDLNLNDTGVLRVNGTWQRAPALRDTPLDFSVEWDGAQLGQLTKMMTRADQGWRGGVQLAMHLLGTPTNLKVDSHLAIQDFRRYDITHGEQLRLAAYCVGRYSALDHAFHDIMCNSPVGAGSITLKGDMGFPGSRRYSLVLMAESIPASAVAALAQRAKKNLPDDLIARGLLQGSVTIDETMASNLQIEGQGDVAKFSLTSAMQKAEISAQLIPFAFTSAQASTPAGASRRAAAAPGFVAGPHFELGPVPIELARPGASPATVHGWMNRSGYSVSLAGEADIAKTLRAARLLGLSAGNPTAEGAAQISLQVAGAWPGWSNGSPADFAAPKVTGKAKLRNVRVSLRGTGGPVEVATADLYLDSDQVRVEKLNARAGDSSWTGSVEMPRGCGAPGACQVRFRLSADEIALDELSQWAKPGSTQRPWYRVLESSASPGPSFLGSLRASGRLTAERLQLHGFALSHASANVELDRGRLKLSDLAAATLGGKHLGVWQLDFSKNPAVCAGTGSLTGVALSQFAEAAKLPDLEGVGNGSYKLAGPCSAESGVSFAAFWNLAEGSIQFDLSNGVLPRFAVNEGDPSLPFTRLSGQAQLGAGEWEMKNVKLDSPNGRFQVSGTASGKQVLDLKMEPSPSGSAPAYAITGTVTEPRIEAMPRTEQARLKPDPAK